MINRTFLEIKTELYNFIYFSKLQKEFSINFNCFNVIFKHLSISFNFSDRNELENVLLLAIHSISLPNISGIHHYIHFGKIDKAKINMEIVFFFKLVDTL